jgi:hypothetical protein
MPAMVSDCEEEDMNEVKRPARGKAECMPATGTGQWCAPVCAFARFGEVKVVCEPGDLLLHPRSGGSSCNRLISSGINV